MNLQVLESEVLKAMGLSRPSFMGDKFENACICIPFIGAYLKENTSSSEVRIVCPLHGPIFYKLSGKLICFCLFIITSSSEERVLLRILISVG